MWGGFGPLFTLFNRERMMRCLVTGGTGFIGRELCRQLRSRGVEVSSVGREPPTPEQLLSTQLLYHCAGVAHQSASDSDHEQGNYLAVLDMAERAAAAGVRSFVFISTVMAAAEGGSYARWKWRAEQALTDIYRDSTMTVVCVRPALVYGVGARANLQSLMRAVRRGMPKPPAGGARSMVGLPDLCDALCQLLKVNPGQGTVLNITDGENYDLRRIYLAIRQGLGRTPGHAWLPGWCWRLGCGVLDLVRGSSGEQAYYQKLFAPQQYSGDAACKALQWQARYTLEDLMPAMLAELD
jgi:UDP-glucose 4-epimerase